VKECYFIVTPDTFKPVIADLSPPGRNACFHWHIHRINVPYVIRGKGYGRQILADIIDAADAEGSALCLWPHESGGLSKTQLINWYERHGFVRDASKCGWVRYPGDIPNRLENDE
jgi:GNAT superfamily N-acetyltransferase